MSSLIPGFEYDVFISYRQKDNKGDRWVSEFVEALKTELESTFKEEISVFFDINPHDGLLETHDVDASLKEKLKCLVFIPILSRTYCDPKSFAWENEFKAFAEQASNDQFGLKVKLANGNIANRIFPVRIHDLDEDDIRLCESVTGGALHEIEFIYISTGVNRPLRSKEDNPQENMNRTFYRDQINKTVLAIKEIILGLKGEPDMSVKKNTEHREQERAFYEVRKPARLPKKKLLIGAGILAILIIATLFVWPGLIEKNNLESLVTRDGKIPLAVMPFQNMTNDTLWDVWQDGIQNILITSLSNSNEFKVRQLGTITSILKSKGLTDYTSLTPSVAGLISKKLETSVHIQGNIKQSGNTMRLSVQLINTKTGEAFKSFQIDGTADNILPAIDSLSRMVQDFLLISIMQKEKPNYYSPIPTKSPDAYRYVIYAHKAFERLDFSTSIELGLRALEIDSTLYYLYAGFAMAYHNLGQYEQAKKWCFKANSKLDLMDMNDKIFANYSYALICKTPNEAIRYLEEWINLDDQNPESYYGLGDTYWTMHQWDKAIPWFEKSLEIYHKWDSKPWLPNYEELGESFHGTGQYKKEERLYKKAEKDFPDDPSLISYQARLALTEKDTSSANRYIKKFISIGKDQSWTEAVLAFELAWIYDQGGVFDKAEEYYRKAQSLEPEIPGRIRWLAFFLIDKDRNVDEGLTLVEKYITLKSENYLILDVKGWGLYKKGKYQEALETLQKSWELRMKDAIYDHDAFLHLEAAKKAVAGQE